MKIYIASRFRNKQIIATLIASLPPEIQIVSTWHTLADDDDGPSDLAVIRDLEEIKACDACLVLTTDCERVPGGMHFEAGYAYALGKTLYLCGPAVNIFLKHCTKPWSGKTNE